MNLWKKTAMTTMLAAGVSLWTPADLRAQALINVLYWGGPGSSPHNPAALRDTLQNYLLFNHGMMVHYREDPSHSWLHPDSLAGYDVILAYTSNRGEDAGGTDITTAQFAALTDWIESGKVLVSFHGSTNTYYSGGNPPWIRLLGARFLDHAPGNNAGTITFTDAAHQSLEGAQPLPPSASNDGREPYWDEGRRHQQFVEDTIVIARAQIGEVNVPWIWVREQGDGFVYYNASGHDGQTWTMPQWKSQVVTALEWGACVGDSATFCPDTTTPVRGQAAIDALVKMHNGMISVPAGTPHELCVHDMQGRQVMVRHSSAERHDLTTLPSGTYSVQVLSEERQLFRTLYRNGK